MSFKTAHNPHSEVARSMEKIALEKGLVSPQPLKTYKSPAEALKTAQALQPTDNLLDNILKLCQGLRAQGLSKYATQIEAKFLQYKQADNVAASLYDVWHQGEPKNGDELLYSAHQEGSHVMKDVEGDAVIEDLLDKQKKIKEVISKQPTGKLAAQNAVNIAKIILAQGQQSIQALLTDAYNFVQKAIQIAEIDGSMYDMNINFAKGRAKVIMGVANLDAAALGNKQLEDVKNAIEAIERVMQPDLLHAYLPNVLTKGIGDEAAWTKAKGFLDAALSKVQAAKDQLIVQQTETKSPPAQTEQVLQAPQTPAPQASPEEQRLTALLAKVQQSSKLDQQKGGEIQDWLGGINLRLQNPTTQEAAKKELMDAEKALAPYV